VTADSISDDRVINSTFEPQDQPSKRISQAWVYYGLIDPTKKRDDLNNYRSSLIVQDTTTETIFGSPAIKKIFADGIAQGGSGSADRVGNITVGRMRYPPRLFKFSQLRGADIEPVLGAGYNLDWRTLQDASGEREATPVQIIRVKPNAATLYAEAEEMRFNAANGDIDPNTRTILINFNSFNINLRTIHDQLYPSTFGGITIVFLITQTSGSNSPGLPAIDAGTWPSGTEPIVVISGRGQGAGGNGSGAGQPSGQAGGIALYTRSNINLVVSGQLYGGGGGGGMWYIDPSLYGGGGGAGTLGGAGGLIPNSNQGSTGTSEDGGLGGFSIGGSGGDPGQAGTNGNYSNGGAAGAAIDGVSYVTFGTWGGSPLAFTAGGGGEDILGPQIN
jgi:hypothetical protein